MFTIGFNRSSKFVSNTIRSNFSKNTIISNNFSTKAFSQTKKNAIKLAPFTATYFYFKKISQTIRADDFQNNLTQSSHLVQNTYRFVNGADDIPRHISWYSILLKDWKEWLFAIVTAIASSSIGIAIPSLTGKMLDTGLKQANSDDFTMTALKVVATLTLHAAVQVLSISALTWAGEKLSHRLKCELFSCLVRKEMEYFDTNITTDMISSITEDVQQVKQATKHSVSLGVRHTTQLVGGIVQLFFISSKLTSVLLIMVPVMVGIGSVYGRFLRMLSRQTKDATASVSSCAQESLYNIRIVRGFTNEEYEIEKFEKKSEEVQRLGNALGLAISMFQGTTSLAMNGLIFGLYFIGKKDMSEGELMSYMIYATKLQHSFGQISVLFGQVSKGVASAMRIASLLSIKPSNKVITHEGDIQLNNLEGDLSFKSINFRYPSRPHVPVLSNVNFEIKKGQVVALVGQTGSGKSTIASLLERFYDTESGLIELDGVDIKKLDAEWLRSKIGIVTQDPILFATTIEENIRYGRPNATNEEIASAAEKANCSFISNFPAGINTLVGERGVQLSGGQKQRIAIARAILRDPEILILDEATSSLDNESERVVQQALDVVMEGRTVLVIAHRLSTIQQADLIVCLKQGELEESGTHQELLKKKGYYYNLVNKSLN